MKMNEFKIGMHVQDTWFDYWGTGVVVKILKTRVKIKFVNYNTEGDITTFDKDHVRYLKAI